MTPEGMERLEALARAATPGPWGVNVHDAAPDDPAVVTSAGGWWVMGGDDESKDNPADAAYIAATDPSTVLALIARVKRISRAHGSPDQHDHLGEPAPVVHVVSPAPPRQVSRATCAWIVAGAVVGILIFSEVIAPWIAERIS